MSRKYRRAASDGSYFEASKAHQQTAQSALLRRLQKKPELARELADSAHALASEFFEEVGNSFDTDCKRGCSYCCHQPATTFAFEAIRIAEVLRATRAERELKTLVDKMETRVRGFEGGSVRKNVNKTPCPLLENDQCSVYANRPLTCRLAHSFSVKKCRLAFQKDRGKVEIPVTLELITGVSGIIEAAFDGLPKAGLDGNLYELCSAVLRALAEPEVASQWADGDSRAFENCIKDDT